MAQLDRTCFCQTQDFLVRGSTRDAVEHLLPPSCEKIAHELTSNSIPFIEVTLTRWEGDECIFVLAHDQEGVFKIETWLKQYPCYLGVGVGVISQKSGVNPWKSLAKPDLPKIS